MANMGKSTKRFRVLFVCLGNICRSPAAEGIMRHLVEEQGLENEFEIESAGIGAWHVGQLPDDRMRRCASERGYWLGSHARQIERNDLENCDLIIVMDKENLHDVQNMAHSDEEKVKIRLMTEYCTSRFASYKEVPDPYYGGSRGFELVLDMLEDACNGLISRLTKE